MTYNMTRILAAMLLALAVSGCAIVESSTANQAKTDLVGFSQERILTCMGAPSAEKAVGQTEVWTYSAGQVVGNASSFDSLNCTANIMFQDDTVSSVSYNGHAGGLFSPSMACYQLIKNCVR